MTAFVQVMENLESCEIYTFHFPDRESHGKLKLRLVDSHCLQIVEATKY